MREKAKRPEKKEQISTKTKGKMGSERVTRHERDWRGKNRVRETGSLPPDRITLTPSLDPPVSILPSHTYTHTDSPSALLYLSLSFFSLCTERWDDWTQCNWVINLMAAKFERKGGKEISLRSLSHTPFYPIVAHQPVGDNTFTPAHVL